MVVVSYESSGKSSSERSLVNFGEVADGGTVPIFSSFVLRPSFIYRGGGPYFPTNFPTIETQDMIRVGVKG